MPIIHVDDPKDNIWEHNPELELITEFKELKKKLGPKKSSQVLTAIYLIYDPKSNLRESMSEDEVKEDVTKNYLFRGFKWENFEDIKQVYLQKNLSQIDKLFSRFEQDLLELNDILKSMTLTEANAKKKIDLLKQYKVLFEDYLELKSKVDIEKSSAKTYGNYRESIIEKFA